MTPSPYGALSDELEGLIERVGKATGPDREIDAEIAEALEFQFDKSGTARKWSDDGLGIVRFSSPGGWESVPHYTASIDAALALVERMLPGWMVVNLCEWEADVLRARGAWTCTLKKLGTQGDFTADEGSAPHAPTPALAIISALLAALRSLQTGDAK